MIYKVSLNRLRNLNVLQTVLKQAQRCRGTLLLYGSSAHSFGIGRDIDVLVVSNEISAPTCQVIPVKMGNQIYECHFYSIPEKVFLDDLYRLEYGGYYVHKVALGFEVLSLEANAVDAPYLFWSYEWKLYYPTAETLDVDMFIRCVHLKILTYRPTFARVLGKYVGDLPGRENLIRYVTHRIVKNGPKREEGSVIGVGRCRRRWESALYRFWWEYQKHKGYRSEVWSLSTLTKFGLHIPKREYAALKAYFGILVSNANSRFHPRTIERPKHTRWVKCVQ